MSRRKDPRPGLLPIPKCEAPYSGYPEFTCTGQAVWRITSKNTSGQRRVAYGCAQHVHKLAAVAAPDTEYDTVALTWLPPERD